MRHLYKLLIIPIGLLCTAAWANNARVSNVLRLDAGGAKNVISFDVSWDNSWNVGGTPGNHDALWTFIKFRECGVGGTWTHGLLSTTMTNHTFASSVTFADSVRLSDRQGNLPGGATESNGLGHNTGILIRRSNVGVGNILNATCTITLTNTTAQLDPAKVYDIRVFVIEMVQVKEEGFPVGDGGSSNTFNSVSIDSEAALAADALYSGSAILPADYPKGYQMFYCMKYEISQSQFANFLNHANPAGGSPMGYYNVNRNYLGPGASGAESLTPCNAQNYMQWSDLLAYMDWAALRPMTELEYEKVALGPPGSGIAPTYAWGTNTVTKAWVINSPNEDGTETVVTYNANAHYYTQEVAGTSTTSAWGSVYISNACCYQRYNYSTFDASRITNVANALFSASNVTTRYIHAYPVLALNDPVTPTDYVGSGFGPIGVGIFARDTTLTRMTTGGSYYGAMELSGNVSEQCVNVVSTTYTGTWGNGYLSAGAADVAGWPAGTDSRAIRGGGYGSDLPRLGVADRLWAASTVGRLGPNAASYRQGDVGGRGVR